MQGNDQRTRSFRRTMIGTQVAIEQRDRRTSRAKQAITRAPSSLRQFVGQPNGRLGAGTALGFRPVSRRYKRPAHVVASLPKCAQLPLSSWMLARAVPGQPSRLANRASKCRSRVRIGHSRLAGTARVAGLCALVFSSLSMLPELYCAGQPRACRLPGMPC
jgi:hypothetical protein